MADDTDKTFDVAVLDPKEYLKGNRRIVVDTSALLESREGYAGGVPQLVMNCAEALAANPLVIPKAVINELTNQTSTRRARQDPELAERATSREPWFRISSMMGSQQPASAETGISKRTRIQHHCQGRN